MAEDFRKRVWISLALTLLILALSPLLQSLLGLRYALGFPGDRQVVFGFLSAVFWCGRWPVLKGLCSVVTARKPEMMTLVAVAITTAYPYSSTVFLGWSGKMFFWFLPPC